MLRRRPSTSASAGHRILPWVLLLGAAMAISVVGAIWWLDRTSDSRRYAALNAAMLTANWDRIIDIGQATPASSRTVIQQHLVNRALYHKGRLLSDLFAFPQTSTTLLLDINDNMLGGRSYLWKHAFAGWTFFELGLVNSAENSACEAVTLGHRPSLWLLSMIYHVKGLPDAARICLGAVRTDPAYRRRADEFLRALNGDRSVKVPEQIEHVRSVMLRADRLQTADSPLPLLLQEHPGNRMAFEYRVAQFLIEGELDSVAASVGALRALQYPRVPRLCEEALMIREMITGKEADLRGYTIGPQTLDAFKGFFSTLVTTHAGDAKAAYPDLLKSHGDSYFFYYTYRLRKGRAS